MDKEITSLDAPLITIITVVYNGEKYLEQTIQSVINQTYKNIEYVVIDGGSTDTTLDIIKQYTSEISYVISEPDDGIADAMNKGIRLSHGEYILFIHADDYLFSENSLNSIQNHLLEGYDIILNPIYFGDGKKIIQPNGFNFWTNLKFSNPHQGIICKKNLFKQYGLFNSNFKINMDYDFFLRVYRNFEKQAIKMIITDKILTVMGSEGISSQTDWKSLSKRFKEEKIIHYNYINSFALKILYLFHWPLYLTYRKIRYLLTNTFGRIA